MLVHRYCLVFPEMLQKFSSGGLSILKIIWYRVKLYIDGPFYIRVDFIINKQFALIHCFYVCLFFRVGLGNKLVLFVIIMITFAFVFLYSFLIKSFYQMKKSFYDEMFLLSRQEAFAYDSISGT